jgi:tetratricopeptide (TPR) repeat protein
MAFIMLSIKTKNLIIILCMCALSCSREKQLQSSFYDDAKDLEKDGKITEALNLYKKSASLMPTSEEGSDSLFRLGEIYYNQNMLKHARKYYELFSEVQTADTQRRVYALLKVGQIYSDFLDDNVSAVRVFSNILKISSDPGDNFLAYLKIGRQFFDIFKFETSLDYFKKAKQIMEKEPVLKNVTFLEKQELLYYLAYSYTVTARDVQDKYDVGSGYGSIDKESIETAIELLETCMSMDEKSKYGIMCLSLKATAHRDVSENDKAYNALTELRQIHPNSQATEYRLKKLEDKQGQ